MVSAMVSPGDGALGRYEFVAACEAPGPPGPGLRVDGCKAIAMQLLPTLPV